MWAGWPCGITSYHPCSWGNCGILLKDYFFFCQFFRYPTQTQMLNSIILWPKVPKLIITNLDFSFIVYLRMTITIVSSGCREIWITWFQEVTSKTVITRNVQTTITYYDLQRKSHWTTLKFLGESLHKAESLPSFLLFSEIILFQFHL